MGKKSKDYKQKMLERKQKRDEYLDISSLRTKDERRNETLQIIYQLKQNDISSEYQAVKDLIQIMNEYVELGESRDVHIPFPEKNKIIKGKLPIHKKDEPVVMLKHIE